MRPFDVRDAGEDATTLAEDEFPDIDTDALFVADVESGGLERVEKSLIEGNAGLGRRERFGYGAALPPSVSYVERDQELVEGLRVNGFQGRGYDLFREQLVTYGLAVLPSLIKTGKMQRLCSAKGRPVGAVPPSAGPQDYYDLAVDAAMDGAVLFHRAALVGGTWSPDRGASLLTYYIGACIQVYPTVYRRWFRTHMRWSTAELMAEPAEQISAEPNQEIVALRLLLQSAMGRLHSVDERAYIAITMKAQGYTHPLIAQALGCPSKSVDRLVSRGRRKCQQIIEESGGLG